MKNLEYLIPFKDFEGYGYKLNESLGDAGQTAINRAFINMPDIPLTNGEFLKPKEIVSVVQDAIKWISDEFRTYYSFARNCNIIYLVNCPDCTTMAVDQYMNMYMDALFIYKTLKMDPQLVAAVIMHEIFHVVYNHIERGKNWLSANGRPASDFRDTNLAGDIEVNTTLINKGIIDEQRLVGEIHGLYLKKFNGDRTNIPMEMILENEALMAKLREMVDGPKDTRPKMDTSKDWDDGYKKGWDKIAELVDKYGPEETIKKLQNAGIIDKQGQFMPDIDEEVIMGMNFIVVKSFDEFINESTSKNFGEKVENQDLYQTYDDGFKTGVQKAIGMVWGALNPQEDGGGGGGQQPNQPVPKTNLKSDDLKKLNLPKPENKNQEGKSQLGDNLPTNTSDDTQTEDKNQIGNIPKGDDALKPNDDEGGKESQGGGGNNNNNMKKSGQQKDQNANGGGTPKESGKSSENGQQSDESQSGQSGQDSQEGGQSSNGQGQEGQSGQGGGSGNSQSTETTSDDVNKLANDLKNKGKKNIDQNVGYADKPNGNGSDPDSIGGTGSFMDDKDSSFAKKVLEQSGYSDEDIQKIIGDTVEKNKTLNTPEAIKEKRKQLHSKLSPSDPVKKLLDDIAVSEEKYKNIWKRIMKQFLGTNCRHAQRGKRSDSFDWKNKRAMSLGRLAPNFHKEEQEPQFINIYVDVSGSVNEDLLSVIAKSLSLFCKQYEYTGINIIPWATKSTGVHEVEALKKSNPEKVAKEILGYISQGIKECGGGTSLLEACVPQIIEISNNKNRRKKDDKHIIITDGETFGQEEKVEQEIASGCGAAVNRNCFYMIYDARGDVRSSWEKSIQKGTLLFINSEVVIGNG